MTANVDAARRVPVVWFLVEKELNFVKKNLETKPVLLLTCAQHQLHVKMVCHLLCISTSKRVLHSLFASQNHLFLFFYIFCHHKQKKQRQKSKRAKFLFSALFQYVIVNNVKHWIRQFQPGNSMLSTLSLVKIHNSHLWWIVVCS